MENVTFSSLALFETKSGHRLITACISIANSKMIKKIQKYSAEAGTKETCFKWTIMLSLCIGFPAVYFVIFGFITSPVALVLVAQTRQMWSSDSGLLLIVIVNLIAWLLIFYGISTILARVLFQRQWWQRYLITAAFVCVVGLLGILPMYPVESHQPGPKHSAVDLYVNYLWGD